MIRVLVVELHAVYRRLEYSMSMATTCTVNLNAKSVDGTVRVSIWLYMVRYGHRGQFNVQHSPVTCGMYTFLSIHQFIVV